MNLKRLVLGALETNCYVVWSDYREGIIIDPADEPDQILAILAQEQLTVRAVVLTHVHFDHMLAAEAICAHTGATLYVGDNDRLALSDPQRNLSGWFQPDNPVVLKNARSLHEGDILTLGEERLQVMETPGHTPGGICLYDGAILFSGDTLFRNSIGRLDFPGGDRSAMKQSLDRILLLPDDTVVYAGHGPATTIATEKKYNPYIG